MASDIVLREMSVGDCCGECDSEVLMAWVCHQCSASEHFVWLRPLRPPEPLERALIEALLAVAMPAICRKPSSGPYSIRVDKRK